MTIRATQFGGGRPGGQIDYRGDVIAPTQSYASSQANTPMISRLSVPPSTNQTSSAVVKQSPRRGGMRYFLTYGAMRMPLPVFASGPGQVPSSAFQSMSANRAEWDINPDWAEAGYPRNLGWSTKVPQLQTNITGGPGTSAQTAKPLFGRVQVVPRSRVTVRTYPTRGQ